MKCLKHAIFDINCTDCCIARIALAERAMLDLYEEPIEYDKYGELYGEYLEKYRDIITKEQI